jgi:hypothetical protein
VPAVEYGSVGGLVNEDSVGRRSLHPIRDDGSGGTGRRAPQEIASAKR